MLEVDAGEDPDHVVKILEDMFKARRIKPILEILRYDDAPIYHRVYRKEFVMVHWDGTVDKKLFRRTLRELAARMGRHLIDLSYELEVDPMIISYGFKPVGVYIKCVNGEPIARGIVLKDPEGRYRLKKLVLKYDEESDTYKIFQRPTMTRGEAARF